MGEIKKKLRDRIGTRKKSDSKNSETAVKTVSRKRRLKKGWKKWVALSVFLVVVAVGIVVGKGMLDKNTAMGAEIDTTSASRSATAEVRTISTTIEGSGNLTAASSEEVTVPSGVKISEVFVESGDTVAEGDVIATIDKDSLNTRMATIQNEINTIDSEIEDILSEDESETIDTYVSGRVKKIYAAEGDSVTGVVLENGSLMVLSMDGKMAVDIESSVDASVGDDVEVVLSDGTTIDGTISSIGDGVYTVTMDDESPAFEEEIIVNNEDGTALGSGQVYISQPSYITGSSGTVSTVDVDVDDEVSAGDELITLTDVAVSSEYLELVEERAELVDTLQSLVELSQTCSIVATYSGTIENVNIEAGSTTSSSSTTSTDSSGYMSSNSSTETASISSVNAVTVSTSGDGTETAAEGSTDESTAQTVSESESEGPEIIYEIKDLDLELVAPVTGQKVQSKLTFVDGTPYTGTISWNTTDSTFKSSTIYKAKIELTAASGYKFSTDDITSNDILTNIDDEVAITSVSVNKDAAKNTLSFTVIFSATEEEETEPQQTETTGQTENSVASSGTSSSGSSSSMSSSSASTATSSGSASSDTSSSSTTSSTSSSSSEYSDVTAFTIIPNVSMSISISVDELDILSVSEGQEVTVTLDAIEGEFTGEVTDISTTASASGGVVTYSATVTIPKDENMLSGMSASATIVIEQVENIVTVPAGAVQEMGNSIFVYTEYDEETGTLSGQVEVETGLSDGDYIEITSGLSEGDVVYYTAVSSTDDTSGTFDMNGFGSFGGSGEMPSMDDMPSGGSGGSMPSGGGGGSMPGGGQ